MEWLRLEQWSPYAVGIAIGVLSWFTFLLSDKALGASTAYVRTSGLIARLAGGKKVLENPYYRKFVPQIDWEWMLVLGIVVGAYISARLSGTFETSWVPALWAGTFGDAVGPRIATAFVGGIFMGFGARWAGGCTSGHGISGAMQLTVVSWVTAVSFFLGGIAAAKLLFLVIGR
jgi:hypothetical protein